jgi:hypothetical protein
MTSIFAAIRRASSPGQITVARRLVLIFETMQAMQAMISFSNDACRDERCNDY